MGDSKTEQQVQPASWHCHKHCHWLLASTLVCLILLASTLLLTPNTSNVQSSKLHKEHLKLIVLSALLTALYPGSLLASG